MTVVKCEAATFMDAVQKACRVAPTKGHAFDRAGGIWIEVGREHLAILATDLESTYNHQIPAAIEGDETNWLVPSFMLSGVVANFPLGTGELVRMEEKDGYLHTYQGRSRSRIRLLSQTAKLEWPTHLTKPFSENDLRPVEDLTGRIMQVTWACSDEEARAPLTGVHVDGERLIATDGYVVAIVPCRAPVDEPLTVPLRNLAMLVRDASGVVKLGSEGDRLQLALDQNAQATTTIFNKSYPDMDTFLRRPDDFMATISFDRVATMEGITSLLLLAQNDRYPRLHLTISGDELKLRLAALGEQGDSEITFHATGFEGDEPFECELNPNYLRNALATARDTEVKFDFGPDRKQMMRIHDSSGYECHIMPMVGK